MVYASHHLLSIRPAYSWQNFIFFSYCPFITPFAKNMFHTYTNFLVLTLFLQRYRSKPIYTMDLGPIGPTKHPHCVCVISVINFNHFRSPCDQIQLGLKQNYLFLKLRLYLLSIISNIISLGLWNLSAKLFFCQFSKFVSSTKTDTVMASQNLAEVSGTTTPMCVKSGI